MRLVEILRNLFKGKKKNDEEWMIWVGDGMAPAGSHLVGLPVDFNGRKGVVVDTTMLQILVRWDT